MTTTQNYFTELYGIDVNAHLEKKGGFSYLSWPFAVSELKKRYPSASWEVKRFDGLPFQKTDLGYFVEVSVTAAGVTHSQIHPVLDNKNKVIETPNAFDINTSIQRCLVKAIGLHGLGLYVYAGEDVPNGNGSAEPPPEATEQEIAERAKPWLEKIKGAAAADAATSLWADFTDEFNKLPESEKTKFKRLHSVVKAAAKEKRDSLKKQKAAATEAVAA